MLIELATAIFVGPCKVFIIFSLYDTAVYTQTAGTQEQTATTTITTTTIQQQTAVYRESSSSNTTGNTGGYIYSSAKELIRANLSARHIQQ